MKKEFYRTLNVFIIITLICLVTVLYAFTKDDYTLSNYTGLYIFEGLLFIILLYFYFMSKNRK